MNSEGKKKASKRYSITHNELADELGCCMNYVARSRNKLGLSDDEIRAKWGMDRDDPAYLYAVKTAKMANNLPQEIYDLASKAGVGLKQITEAKLNKGFTMAQVREKYAAKKIANATHIKTPKKEGRINAHTIAAKTGMQLKHVNMLRLKGHSDADIMTHGLALFDTGKASAAAARKAAKENPGMPPGQPGGPATGIRQQPSNSNGDITDLYDATYRKESATARIKEFELYTKLKDVVPVAEEAVVWATVARVTRDSLMMIIDRVAGSLAAMDNEKDIKLYLRDHFEIALKNIPERINAAYLELIEKTEGESYGATA